MKQILLLLTISVVSCNSRIQPASFNRVYSKGLKAFDSNLVEHFPKSARGLKEAALSNAEGCGDCHLGASFEAVFYAADSSVYSYLNQNPYQIDLSLRDTSCMFHTFPKSVYYYNESKECSKMYPIPAFLIQEFFDANSNSNMRFPSDITFYILEYKKGKVLKDELLYRNDKLPSEWMHGMSRGIAYSPSAKIMVFWIDMW